LIFFEQYSGYRIGFLCLSLVLGHGFADQAGNDYFENFVRPIFHDECIKCHGAEKQKGGFALHQKTLAFAGGDLGIAIAPGALDRSLMIKAIERGDKDLQMPPKKELTQEHVKILKTWISMGAPWPDDQSNTSILPAAKRIDEVRKSHWSLQPLKAVAFSNSVQIERVVKETMKQVGFEFSQPASARDLIRRVYYDLIGLPPSMDEVESFESDSNPNAYANMIERLLSKPEYGEHWGRHWLDVARYGDTKGAKVPNESIHYPYAYTYRDYVVDAFNQDMPYHQFIEEQLAVDLMGDAKQNKEKRLAALGFLRVGPNFLSNQDLISDKIDVVTRGFLGLTVSCARCHDHKTDPITIKDYYALYGVFNNSHSPAMEEYPIIAEVENAELREKYDEEVAAIDKKYSDKKAEFLEKANKSLKEDIEAYLVYYLKTEGKYQEKVENSDKSKLNNDAMVRWKRTLAIVKKDHPVMGPFVQALDVDPAQMKAMLATLKEEMKAGKWQMSLQKAFIVFFENRVLQTKPELAAFYAHFLNHQELWGEKDSSLYKEIADLYERLPTQVPLEDAGKYFTQAENSKLRDILSAKVELAVSSEGAPHRAMVLYDKDKVSDQYVFLRGDSGRRGDKVNRRFLEVLLPMTGGEDFGQGSGRLALAQAITNPNNPLTARVMVNRIWNWHFGKSLVSSPSDFGMMTEKPLQIELLDRLARTFIDSGWSIKAMHRLIMNSKVYRQSSDFNAVAYEKDPENHYLWRFNRQRLSLEQMRDSMLSISGRLKLDKGGKPFDIDEFVPRRTLYAKVDRNMIPDVLVNFDAGNLNSSLERRPVTSVPQQALFLLNDEFVLDTAEKIAHHEKLRSLEGQQWLRGLFHLTYAREPSVVEVNKMNEFIKFNQVDMPNIKEYQWQYGYSDFNPESKRIDHFSPMQYYSGTDWRMGEVYPDKTFRYMSLSAKGGHAGDKNNSAVRRWTSPQSGVLKIASILKHSREGGDGIYGYVISDKKGLLGEWHAYQSEAEVKLSVAVESNERIDFVVYCGKNTTCDSFEWDPIMRLITPDDELVWQASEHFSGPREKKILNQQDALAHILIMSNEFHFVD